MPHMPCTYFIRALNIARTPTYPSYICTVTEIKMAQLSQNILNFVMREKRTASERLILLFLLVFF